MGGIFLIQEGGKLVELTSTAYDSEALLQELLARYPNLLAGDQIDPTVPRRWLLVNRETSVPGEQAGSGRWSLDHLLLDQEAIPTLIEVKRSSDTRIRREVVGQMLDYAANAVAYWPIESLRAAFETRCTREGISPDQELVNFLGPEVNPDHFWQSVKTNLQAGRIRLVFVADNVPPELRRIVEFLNQQMDPAEVLAVEIRQYVGGSFQGLIPRVFGQTEQAQQKKHSTTPGGRLWEEAVFFDEVAAEHGDRVADVARKLFEWAKARSARLTYGSGVKHGSLFVTFDHRGESISPIAIWTYGKIEVQFQGMRNTVAFGADEKRRELQRRLNDINGVVITDDALTKRPSVWLSTLEDAAAFAKFIDVLEWIETEIKKR
jgi:hypothetical protein